MQLQFARPRRELNTGLGAANSNLEWKLIGSVLCGGSGIALPETWKEIMVIAYRTSGRQYTCPLNIFHTIVSNRSMNFQFGAGRGDSGYDIKYQCAVSSSSISAFYVYFNASDVTSAKGHTFEIYYR